MDHSKEYLSGSRREYGGPKLDISDLTPEPFTLFQTWFSAALEMEITDANAMMLATCGKNGQPSARIILIREFSEDGLVFFTNYNSAKAKQIAENPKIALTVYWHQLDRQVRIEGVADKLSDGASDVYFRSRPRSSQLSAWASPQSEPIADRSFLEKTIQKLEAKFKNREISRPPHWGGFIIKPLIVEFWQGRASRLHDRFIYQLDDELWKIKRLAP